MTKKQGIAIAVSAVILAGIVIAINTLGPRILLKAGKPMQFGEYTVLIDRVDGNKLYGIKVSSKDKRFKAESGDYAYLPEKNALKFNLVDGSADDYDPENPSKYHALTFKQFSFTIKLKSPHGPD